MSAPVRRFASVDALRGLTVAAMLLVNTPGDWGHVYAPLLHADWHGCTPTDLVFPFFLFVVGVSIALGIVPRVERGDDLRALQRDAILRGLRIVALGLALHVVAWWALDAAHYRPWGVLQRIGLCVLVAAPLAMRTSPRAQWALVLAILLGYWAALAPGGYARFDNLADRVDTALFAPLLYVFEPATGRGHDPEGLLSTVPAIATVLLGVRAGDWLRRGQVRRLCAAGVAMLALGALWSLAVPVNKALWTPSYVLWTGGWAALALAALHVLVDRRGWPAVGRVFGVNAIAAYAGSALIVYGLVAVGVWGALYRHGFAWMAPHVGPRLPSLLFALAFVALWWAIVRVMDRRGWHLKI
ncbi:heparan-alpha-glucosaminide N-acetyltransferase domain-containing protein [Luteimonas sp. M1R5S18]|uniref:Heparan-alpha-glucosaminide N-acetyltransferase domain-containing protein n=1 Tax=Luteimonas rhizosphaericola TaxID=3042024 RepID=A0ABT6JJY4_9GAMM|nr:heparan-alpha-glucosaminide N-acetyltransferase domain-containing protein [Luteimonas rhizosphaericola]MDH5830975.1 heparan-alpha-glucosaminide N-acetyltransferase domain-containing protein [Luteimonas rhizosphaericola]